MDFTNNFIAIIKNMQFPSWGIGRVSLDLEIHLAFNSRLLNNGYKSPFATLQTPTAIFNTRMCDRMIHR